MTNIINNLLVRVKNYQLNSVDKDNKPAEIKLTFTNFQEKVDQINLYLAENFLSHLRENNEVDDSSGNKNFYNFDSEFIKFIVNKTMGPLNWRIKHTSEVGTSEIIVTMEIEFKVYKHESSSEFEWFSKGAYIGNKKIWKANAQLGYIQKSAITDAITKTFTLYGIGIAPYLGLVTKEEYIESEKHNPSPIQQPEKPKKPSAQQYKKTKSYDNFIKYLAENQIPEQKETIIKEYLTQNGKTQFLNPDGSVNTGAIPDGEYGLMPHWIKDTYLKSHEAVPQVTQN